MNKNIIYLLMSFFFFSCGNNKQQPAMSAEGSVEKTASVQVDQTETNNVEENTVKTDKQSNNPIIGIFKCNKTGDKYLFNSDGTGCFFTGTTQTVYKWKNTGSIVTITYEMFGDQKLFFDSESNTLTEDSESLGTLVFEKI